MGGANEPTYVCYRVGFNSWHSDLFIFYEMSWKPGRGVPAPALFIWWRNPHKESFNPIHVTVTLWMDRHWNNGWQTDFERRTKKKMKDDHGDDNWYISDIGRWQADRCHMDGWQTDWGAYRQMGTKFTVHLKIYGSVHFYWHLSARKCTPSYHLFPTTFKQLSSLIPMATTPGFI